MRTTKSPRRVLRVAWEVAQRAMRPYSHRFSPKRFTQPQLFACLALKEALKLDYRGTSALLQDAPELRAEVGLEFVPHFTTLQKASVRLLRSRRVQRLLDRTVERARRDKLIGPRIKLAAIDSSGFESHHASRYFVARRKNWRKTKGKPRPTYRHFPKLGILCDCASHLVLAAATEQGPRPDFGHAAPVLDDAERRIPIRCLLGDAGYDAEWIHMYARVVFGTRTIIPPLSGRPPTGPPRGYYRRLMSRRFDATNYHQRSQAETTFSMIKRRLGEAVNARSYWAKHRALLLKVITYNILLLALLIQVFYRASMRPFRHFTAA